jgi:hypothetical protein
MGNQTKKISRLDLYNQVWEIPVTQLSKEYGLSDVGFAKICKKHDIPRPPRGYWARKAAGQHMKKVPLPKRSSDGIIEISPNPLNQSNSKADSKSLQYIEHQQNFPPIVVAKSLRNPHPFVSQSAQILELCEPNHVGILETTDKRCLDIRVSRKSLRRALRILDALIKGLLARGFEVEQNDDFDVHIHGECLGFGISEEVITIKTEPKDTDLDGYYQFGHSRFDQVREPSGKLCLTMHDRGYFWSNNLRRNWRDTKSKSLEDCLDAFVLGLVKRAARKREHRLQKEEEDRQRQEITRQREEQARLRAELERKIQEEKARVDKLINDSENYHKSRQIRDFVAAVENELLEGNTVYLSNDEHTEWVKWARDQADRLDPLSVNPPSILDEADEADVDQSPESKGFESYFKKW